MTSAVNADTVHNLKKELERCLSMYKGKREQLTATTEELKGAKNTLEDLKQKLDKTEKQLKETKVLYEVISEWEGLCFYGKSRREYKYDIQKNTGLLDHINFTFAYKLSVLFYVIELQ